MVTPNRGTVEWVRDGRAAISEALARTRICSAWDLLQERDADGNALGPLPYTDQAIREFEAAHAQDPEDIGVVHHLAIGHHALAWDLELQNSPRAPGEWERALGYWRILAGAGEFWTALKSKLQECDATGDAATVDNLRRDMLEHLLDIHVDFVRHYCETDSPQRATAHVEIVKRARIPPATKKRLVEKVFHAMTNSVPEAKAKQAYDSALVTVDRFLTLFPDYVPALRMYAEICKDWVNGLSYQDRWDEIVTAGRRAEPPMRRLAQHPELSADPLAKPALEELALELALRGRDRCRSQLKGGDHSSLRIVTRDALREAAVFGISWGRIVRPLSSEGSGLRAVFSQCLNDHACSLHAEAGEVFASAVDMRTKCTTALRLCRVVVAETEEALDATPDDDVLHTNLGVVREHLALFDRMQRELGILGNMEATQ